MWIFLNIPFGIAEKEDGEGSVTVAIEPDVLGNLEDAIQSAGEETEEEDYVIAVIDTGMPEDAENVEFVSLLGDEGYDDHGHGTMVFKNIRKQDADTRILSIKALNGNGYGDAATIYAAIRYAIERKVNLINLSISGYATEGNRIIEEAIREAVSQGIFVVGAAGNDNLPASAFIPGGIDEIIVVGACDKENKRKPFSNYGITVDYYAEAGSTSQAAAIVTGVLSANRGDIGELDERFFKTPDLSVFEEELEDVTDKNLLNKLYQFVNDGGFHTAAITMNYRTTDNIQTEIRNAFADLQPFYYVDKSKIKVSNVAILHKNTSSVPGQWDLKKYYSGDNWGVMTNDAEWTSTNQEEGIVGKDGTTKFLVYAAEDYQTGNTTIGADCTLVIKNCVICSNDFTTVYDWEIDITNVIFNFNRPQTDFIDKRKHLITMMFQDNELPQFITGAVNHFENGFSSNTGNEAYKVDAANTIEFTMKVRKPGTAYDTDNSIITGKPFLTGFADLDQYHSYPCGSATYVDESITIKDVSKLSESEADGEDDDTKRTIWFYKNSRIYKTTGSGNTSPVQSGNQLTLHSAEYLGKDSTLANQWALSTAWFATKSGGNPTMTWTGARCGTAIGLSAKQILESYTVKTDVSYQKPVESSVVYYGAKDMPGSSKNILPGYEYLYNAGTHLNDNSLKPDGELYFSDAFDFEHTKIMPASSVYDATTKIISATVTGDKTYHLYVPRKQVTYTFDENKPAGATGTVVNNQGPMAHLYGITSDDATTPTLAGYQFLGYFTEATGGDLYVKSVMTENKKFWAHWKKTQYTITVYDLSQKADGNYTAATPIDTKTQDAGTPGSYDWTTRGASAYDSYREGKVYNTGGTFLAPAAPAGDSYDHEHKLLTYVFTGNKGFYIHVPRYTYTYRFDKNPPTGHSDDEITGMPSDITDKFAETRSGNVDEEPTLAGYTFLGFYDAEDNAYADEEMLSNKTFYARWAPKKYYVRYNGNGETNFNNTATVGMQTGEYKQNTVTGSVAYQVFTYDTAGEALRANGFTRRGYTFVCWNETKTRTGINYDPGYVKPATENWVSFDGTEPTAKLDGVNTYPVVDLYAVWRQKLGTAAITVVSEETGNPMVNKTGAPMGLTLTNTYNNTTANYTTNAEGKVTATGLHWFPYTWTSNAVPAGYKTMASAAFRINPADSADESFLMSNIDRILYMKHVKLTINSRISDVIPGEKTPSFMYHIAGNDVAGVAHSYDVMVQTGATKTGTNIVPVATTGGEEPYMFAGNYTVTQYDVSRYIPGNAEPVSNTTSVGINANANLKDYTTAEVTFPYSMKQYGGFSGVHSLINKLVK